MEIKMDEKIKQCFVNIGIITEGGDNFLIADYVTDSVTYISLMVELEQMFGVEIPDDYLVQGRLETYQDVCNMVEELFQK
jgi:acyl carrier protein